MTALVLGLALWSWVGYALAELGLFSVGRVAAILALPALALFRSVSGFRPARATWVVGVAIAATCAALYLPAYDTSAVASDATIYWNTGVHLARFGALAVPDPLFAELGFPARAALLPLGPTTGWTRMPGGLVVDTDGTAVMWPTYSHLLPVWIATFAGLGGAAAATLVGPVFAALAVSAVFVFAREAAGTRTALATLALVLANAGELFYARFLMPEIVTQLFVWGGLVAFARWCRDERRRDGLVAALALGVAALSRVEYLLFVPLAFALWLTLAPRRPPGTALVAAVLAVVVLHGVAHLLVVPTHYRDLVLSRLATLRARPALLAGPAALAVVAALLAWRTRGRAVRAIVLVTLAVAAAGFLLASRRPWRLAGVPWLALAVPWPVLAASAVGFGTLVRRRTAANAFPLLLFAIVTAILFTDPHVTPSPLWVLRRFVPVTIPFLALLASVALPWRRAPWLAAVAVAGALALTARPTAALRRLPLFPDQQPPLARLAALLPPDAAVFYAPDVAAYAIHVPIWLAHGREGFVLPPWDWRGALRTSAAALGDRHPIFYVSDEDGAPAVPGLAFERAGETAFRFVTPKIEPKALPTAVEEWPLTLRVHRVSVAR